MQAPERPAVLQLDFDGTVVEGDASVGILTHFVGEAWGQTFQAALRSLRDDPASTALIDAMRLGCSLLGTPLSECIAYAREHHPVRPGLGELIETARALGLTPEVVSYGFDFYIAAYLEDAGVLADVTLRCGRASPQDGALALAYTGPDGRPTARQWKEAWTEDYRRRGLGTVYVGDGRSDLAAALEARAVFARDELLANMPASYAGPLRPFDTLHDVATGLRELYG